MFAKLCACLPGRGGAYTQTAVVAVDPAAVKKKKKRKRNAADDLTDEQIVEFKMAFNLFDQSGDGEISTDELGDVFKSLGQDLSTQELNRLIADVDENGDGTVDFPEFLTMMVRKMKDTDDADDLKLAFAAFDRDGSGTITREELRAVLLSLGEGVTDEEVEEVIEGADEDGDADLDFDEFVTLVLGKEKKLTVSAQNRFEGGDDGELGANGKVMVHGGAGGK